MGSVNIWLRARKFLREVSKAKLIHIKRRNSPERRGLLQCIFGYIINVQSSILKGLCYVKLELVFHLNNM